MSADTQAKSLEAPTAEELTPLEISQAMLEGEENPNNARPLTPLESAATGSQQPGMDGERSRLSRALHNPAVAWGGAALAGIGLVAALLYARRTPAGGQALARLRGLKDQLPSKSALRRHRKSLEKALEERLPLRA
jgi:hypothetical protein